MMRSLSFISRIRSRRRRFSLVLIPHSHNRVRMLGGPLTCGIFLGVVFLLTLIIWTVGTTYMASLIGLGKLAGLERENQYLVGQLHDLQRLSVTFQAQMDELREREQATRLVVGLPDIHPDIRRTGAGGPLFSYAPVKAPEFPFDLAEAIQDTLARLLREARLEMASLQDIEQKARSNQTHWQRIPTVRPVIGPTASPYGMRRDPFTDLYHMHHGIDIAGRPDEPVRTTADGTVLRTGVDVDYGRYLDIDHQNGYLTRYAHLSSIAVKKNAHVRRGDIMGYVGKTGKATGYHVHYEVYSHGRRVNPIDHFFPKNIIVD